MIINDLDDYYIVFDTKNRNTELDTLLCCLVVWLFDCLVAWWSCYLEVVCLEDSTERSESNPGRSLGIKSKERIAVWKTVPTHKRI